MYHTLPVATICSFENYNDTEITQFSGAVDDSTGTDYFFRVSKDLDLCLLQLADV